jgi:hypothetical protein
MARRLRGALAPAGALLAAMFATLLASMLAGCTASDTKPPQAAKAEASAPAVTRRPIETPVTPPVATPAPLAVDVPADALYVCVVQRDGQTKQTAIEFTPKVGELCRRHPEMGPCQYERNNCRARGGRVFAAGSVEITMQTEAEYDRKVMRTRFRAN